MKKLVRAVSLAAVAWALSAQGAKTESRADFEIRDPFVLVADGRYWLYESKPWYGGVGVDVRVSDDLEHWSPKKRVMDVPKDVPCTAVWAPEVHRFRDAYYLFVTLTEERGSRSVVAMAADVKPEKLQPRGTWVFRAASPEGPFLPVRNGPITPPGFMALDGTLLVEDGVPYMVYCHEWCQMGNGTIEYAPLKEDFSAFAAEPRKLLDAKSACPGAGFVTDGPFFHRSEKSGRLHLIWSNGVAGNGYCVLVRSSASGKLAGPWTQDRVLYGGNGGHGMIFRALDGRLMLTLHQPNKTPDERMRLFELEDDGVELRLKSASERGRVAETVPFKRLNGLCNTLPLKNDFNRPRFDRLKELYRALEIPETRFHDVALENPGIELVDVSRIFPLFHADEDDPRNYNFAPTDLYLARARELGGELEFRFGETIEHQQVQFQVRPPADIDKWARICRNIARHYNSGWGGGHHWNIRRFSVWEEPDNDRLLVDSKKGNFERCYLGMYAAVARLLKAEWPDVQVGGPNTMGPGEKFKAFVAYCAAEKLPLDFAAYTRYDRDPLAFVQASRLARKILDDFGYAKTELEISEWHLRPVTWNFSDPRYSSSILGPDSAAFSAAVLALGQEAPIDRMFYYAAHVGNWSLFDGIKPRPVYYAMRTFAELARGKRLRLPVNPAEGVYVLASRTSATEGLLMAAFYEVKAGECAVELPVGARPREVKVVSEAREPYAVDGWRFEPGRIVMKVPSGSLVCRVGLEW